MRSTRETARIFETGRDEYRAIRQIGPSTMVHGFKPVNELLAVMEGGFYEDNNVMRLGTGIHAWTLEPDGTRSESKATRHKTDTVFHFESADRSKSIMDAVERWRALGATAVIAGLKLASSLVKHSEKGQTGVGEICGVPFKGRIDLLDLEFRGCIADVKTPQSCDPWLFGRVCQNLYYPLKMSIYRELVRKVHGITLDVKVLVQEAGKAIDTVVYPSKPEKPDTVFDKACVVIENGREKGKV